MGPAKLLRQATDAFGSRYAAEPETAAYAPGRIEVLGNHTDYNKGFVISAAIDAGTVFLVRRADGRHACVYDPQTREEAVFDVHDPKPSADRPWGRYVQGVFHGLQERGAPATGFWAVVLGDIPLGAGLSSSAALEMACGLALAKLHNLALAPLDLARIGQVAEHRFVGVRCGLLDQITSLFGRAHALVMTDFRTLTVETLPLGSEACFLMCHTRVRRALVEGEYNARRVQCEAAAAFFSQRLPHPVRALRDVSWEEWEAHAADLDPGVAARAGHVIGENRRVQEGRRLLEQGDLEGFGRLMFESHESSRTRFENSCPELDALVETAARVPGVLGARLSGGGFGGSVVVLTRPEAVTRAVETLTGQYARRFGVPCDVRVIQPADGARVLLG